MVVVGDDYKKNKDVKSITTFASTTPNLGCYECTAYGDDYYINDDGELECFCSRCQFNGNEIEQ